METVFFKTRDSMLARSRNGGTGPTEVFGAKAKAWYSYPTLDRHTDARPIDRAAAAALLPDGCDESVLDADALLPEA